jgi:hypothetical protein
MNREVADRDTIKADMSRMVGHISTFSFFRLPGGGYGLESCKGLDHSDFLLHGPSQVLCRSINIETLAVFF